MRKEFALFVASMLLSNCSILTVYAQTFTPSDEEKIREAVARYQIAKWDLAAQVYFIEIESKDPNDSFLQRFVDCPKPVKPKSSARDKKDVVGFHIEDRKTKTRGVIFDQEAVQWNSKTSASVEGGYVCATLCMASGSYHVELRDGRWTVTSFHITVQS